MAKIRVYELAKQLEIQSKDIIGLLSEKGIEVKSQSNIEDKEISLVQSKFGKGTAKAEKAPAKAEASIKAEAPAKKEAAPVKKEAAVEKTEAASTNTQAAAAKAEAKPKKKSSITAVFNAQYSNKQPRRQDDRSGNRNGNGDRRQQQNRSNGNRQNDRIRPIRPQDRPVGSHPSDRVNPIRPTEKPVGSRPSDRVNAEQYDKPTPAPRPANTARPEGNRPQSDRPARPAGNRPQSDRPARSEGNRTYNRNDNSSRPSNNYQGNRPTGNRPAGARPVGDRNNGGAATGARPQGQGTRGNYQGNRPNNNNRPQGGYNNGRPDFNRNAGPGNRNGSADKDTNRFGKDAVKTGETRSPEKRNNHDNRKNSNHKPDALGSKRVERYVNLEKNGGKKKNKAPQPKPVEKLEDEIRTLILPEHLTIKELADKMKLQPSAIVKKLFLKGTMVTVNQDVDYDTAEEIALEFNCICEHEVKVDVIAELLKEDDETEENLVSRPPVVCVMGHVDHGKTSLLDAIRDTKVTDREAGGITQHIGAYVVGINGQKITFLDTPGHEAFTAMRMRGANATDIAILVVAADDGVMPQTIEAINHAKAADIEIIVAINKIDKPNANIERVKQELSEYELIPEDWGGSTIFVPVSAHTHEGIDTLLEMILLTAEVCELKANPKRNARGLVVEAQLDKGRGAVATVLVQKGTLHVGDPIAAGSSYGKVRAMIDDNGKRVKVAGPSTPVEILGLSDVPNAGEIFMSMDSEKDARGFAETFVSEGKNKLIEDTKAKMSLDDLFSQIQSGNLKELNIIVKADVQGSVEAVKQSLVKLSNDEVVVKIIHGGVGAINESDIILASASNAIVIGFNVRPDPTAKVTADTEGVDVRLYKVIYNAIEDVEAAMKGMLDPIFEEKIIGHAQVRQIFKSSDVGNIAGSYILDGLFQRGCKVRITRAGEQVFEGDLASLKRFKDDVKEVKAGYECGLVFDGYDELQEEDEVEAYIMVEVPR